MSVSTKVIRTFAFAFLGVFLPALVSTLTNLSETVDWNVAKTALVSAVFAAFAAAIRAIVAFLPVFADDNVGIQKGGGTP